MRAQRRHARHHRRPGPRRHGAAVPRRQRHPHGHRPPGAGDPAAAGKDRRPAALRQHHLRLAADPRLERGARGVVRPGALVLSQPVDNGAAAQQHTPRARGDRGLQALRRRLVDASIRHPRRGRARVAALPAQPHRASTRVAGAGAEAAAAAVPRMPHPRLDRALPRPHDEQHPPLPRGQAVLHRGHLGRRAAGARGVLPHALRRHEGAAPAGGPGRVRGGAARALAGPHARPGPGAAPPGRAPGQHLHQLRARGRGDRAPACETRSASSGATSGSTRGDSSRETAGKWRSSPRSGAGSVSSCR